MAANFASSFIASVKAALIASGVKKEGTLWSQVLLENLGRSKSLAQRTVRLKLKTEVSTLLAVMEELNKKYEAAQESKKQHKADLKKELTSGKVKIDDLTALQVRLADLTRNKNELETKFKDLKDELANARSDL